MSTHHTAIFWILFAALFLIVAFCDARYNMLRDVSTSSIKPFSWARVQLAWWVIIVLAAFITIIICTEGHQIPTLDTSTLILLGITTGTTAVSRLIDVSDQQNPALGRLLQDQPKDNFFLDILSDCNGVSMNRLQAVIFNFVFGLWFISYVLMHFADPCSALHPAIAECSAQPWNYIMPVISQNNLILLGLSSATYAALKATENSPMSPAPNAAKAAAAATPANSPQPDTVPDEATTNQPANG